MTISVIIPFLDEEQALPATLAQLHRERSRGPGVEVIAVDGGSRDGGPALLRRTGWIRVLTASRGRAQQMNAGALAATGDTLLFLHADTTLPDGALRAIDAAARAPDFVYGGFRHRFSGDDWRLTAISALHNYRCGKAQTFYGDQAMFVSAAAFRREGGFPLQLVEDIALSQRLRACGPPAFLPLTVTTSSRKFEKMGIWRSFARVVAILLCLQARREPPRAFFADIR